MSARVTVIGSPEDPIRVVQVPGDGLLPYALEVETVVPRKERITLTWYDRIEEARAGYEALVRAVSEGALEKKESAQPEIIRCKDCRRRELECSYCSRVSNFVEDDFFCADGERRKE